MTDARAFSILKARASRGTSHLKEFESLGQAVSILFPFPVWGLYSIDVLGARGRFDPIVEIANHLGNYTATFFYHE